MKYNYAVQGMTCGHCVAAITEEVMDLPGVSKVTVDLDRGLVEVIGGDDLPAAAVRAAVSAAGYEVVEGTAA
ncbi:MAG: heavy-metal-associated domain-containing protein [Sporichthyaceae bacterium]